MSNTPETQALEPVEVTQAARDAAADYIGPLSGRQTDARLRSGKNDHVSIVQAFARFERDIHARHRQSSNAASVGVDVDPSKMSVEMADLFGLVCKLNRLRAERDEVMRSDGGFTAIERGADLMDEIVDAMPELRRAFDKVHDRERQLLASLSTPTAEPMGEETLGRFGHHPDPATDFEHEVDQIEAIITDLEKGMRAGEAIPLDRIDRAMGFRVGGDAGAVAAKASLRKLETRALALTTPPTPHEFVKNPLIPFPSCQVCMGPEDAEAHSPPTPDRIGKDAVREALEDTMSTLSAVKAEAIVDGGGTCLWIAEKLNQQMIDNRAALSATPAQEGDD